MAVLRPGTGSRSPGPFDRVRLQYVARREDGAEVASTYARGAPVAMRVDETMPGWSSALARMVAGERRRLWIPPELTEGTAWHAGGGRLIVDLELLDVLPGAAPLPAPADLLAPPPSAERTASGLVHALIQPSAGVARAERHDRVRIAYAGWARDGRMIDRSDARSASVEVPVSQGFPGFREALLTLREGEKRRFWIPEGLAYRHYPGAVEGPLVYDIELLAVLDAPPPPAAPEDVAAPPPNARRTSSGVAYRVLQPGVGTRRPGPRSTVELHYSYWSSDGVLIDSTVPNGVPHRVGLKDRDLPPPVIELLQQMVVGEKRRLWVPEALGFPGSHEPVRGPLVFDLELRSLYERKVRVESVEP